MADAGATKRRYSVHQNAEGKTYYHDTETDKTTWAKPEGFGS